VALASALADTRRRVVPGAKWATALAFVSVTVASVVGTAVVATSLHHVHTSTSGWVSVLLVVVLTPLGFLLAIRRPLNPIGWLFLGVGACLVLSALATSYSTLDYVQDHGSLPLGWASLLFAEFWAPGIVLFSVAALLFPDGRPGSRTTRVLLVALLLAGLVWQGGAFGIAVSAIVAHHIHIDPAGDLYAIDHPVGGWAWWYTAAQPAFFLTLGVVWLGWLVKQVPTYRQSFGERRLQLKWLYGGVTACGLGGILMAAFTSSSEPLHALAILGTVLLCALPISVGIALMKFHLYDIDKVVSRTVSYGLVTAFVLAAYVGIISLLTKAIGLSSPVAVAASTLAAAAAFNPLRRRVQRAVDRRFNRARFDAEAVVGAFAASLRNSIDLDTVRAQLLQVIGSAIEPSHVRVWVSPAALSLRGSAGGDEDASPRGRTGAPS
jgi:hypothetical protein